MKKEQREGVFQGLCNPRLFPQGLESFTLSRSISDHIIPLARHVLYSWSGAQYFNMSDSQTANALEPRRFRLKLKTASQLLDGVL